MRNKSLTFVGINDSHNAAACIVRDGRIVCAVAEERLQRVKGMGGFPKNAVECCLETAGLDRSEVDYVVFGSREVGPFNLHNGYATLGVADQLKIEDEYWTPILYDGRKPRLRDILPNYTSKGTLYYPMEHIPFACSPELEACALERIRNIRRDYAAAWFGLSTDRIRFVDHHTAHAYYAYFANPIRQHAKNVLVLTADAGGDSAYESVCVFRDGRFELLHRGHENIIATVYSYMTLLLGMRPNEHEYKVMGLAPYGSEYDRNGPREIFMQALSIEGLAFKRNPEMRDLFKHFADRLRPYRFDAIAGGVQDFTEQYLCQWFSNAVREANVGHVSFAGGLALNVKANKRLTELDEVESLFVPPGPGDESLPIGACFAFVDEASLPAVTVHEAEPLRHAYLGPEASAADVEELLRHPAVRKGYEVVEEATVHDVARLIQAGEICAVFNGRMEFGPRALGNRSIVADPSRPEVVKKVNDAIKMRDFWMPFAPAILEEQFDYYVVNPKRLRSAYMTLTFDTTELGRRHLAAAMHPGDRTVRPQSVGKSSAPEFHALIKAFEDITGIGALLNTSLNIHGKPIVMKPFEIAEEILTRDSVDLGAIYVCGVLLKKRRTAAGQACP